MKRKHLAGTRRQGRGLHQPHPEFQNLLSSSVALTGQGSRGPSQSSRGWGHSAALDTRSRGHLGSHKHSSSRGCVDNRLELPSQWMLDMGCPETPPSGNHRHHPWTCASPTRTSPTTATGASRAPRWIQHIKDGTFTHSWKDQPRQTPASLLPGSPPQLPTSTPNL